MRKYLVLLAISFVVVVPVYADESSPSKSVIGPTNMYLFDGANELLAGNVDEGVKLTMRGLELAQGLREEKVGHANLCAGFMMLGQPDTALVHCNWVLERDQYHWRTYNNRALVYLRLERFEESDADIKRGQEINPRSEKLKEVKGMYLDKVEPVDERITIDDRRNEPQSPVQEPD